MRYFLGGSAINLIKLDKKNDKNERPASSLLQEGGGRKRERGPIFVLLPGFVNDSGQAGEDRMS